MLLKHLYELAHSRKLLDDLAFTQKVIRWVIRLDADGNLIGLGPVLLGDRQGGIKKDCPRILGDTNSGKVADFLAEGIDGMFGLSPDPKKPKDAKKLAAKHEHFWTQINDCFQATGQPALGSILKYQEKLSHQPPAFLKLKDGKWQVISASGDAALLGNDEFAFDVTGEFVLENKQIKAYWKTVFAKMQEDGEEEEKGESVTGICLMTGERATIARTHTPKIKKVPGAQSSGAKIVSFEKSSPSFSSFGRVQSYNAPISEDAATAYCIALNWLLEQPNHRFSIKNAPTVVCFWARDSEEATDVFAELFEQPQPERVQRFLTAPWRGAEHQGIKADEFYSVTLAGNAGRIVVRHWLQCPLETAAENLKRWFTDLQIEPYGSQTSTAKAKKKTEGEAKEAPQPLGLYLLAMTTVREAKDLQPELLTQLYRAALEGHAPSIMLLKPILNRFAKELASDGPSLALRRLSRFALTRLILNRNRKEGEPMIEPRVFDTNDSAYNCGRLLAIFDDLQYRALSEPGKPFEGAGVVERYYGSASSAPNSAFGILWRLHQHHLKKVSRQGDRGRAAAEAIKQKIAKIAALFPPPKPNFPPEFPRSFSLVEQGRFALGFYQQKAADDEARRKAKNTGGKTSNDDAPAA